MATITPRKCKNGTSYRVQIRSTEAGINESKTFKSHALAKAYAAKREAEIQQGRVFTPTPAYKIADLIAEYQQQFGKKYARTKNYAMNALKNADIAQLQISQLTTQHIIKHCIERQKTAKPQTVNNDVVWLRIVIKTMKSVKDFEFDLAIFDRATEVLRREKVIGKSARRERRPTKEELLKLSRFFYHKNTSIPMFDIMWFAIYSCRRLDEITRLKLSDNNIEKKTGMVRDLKNPGGAKGNNKRFKYTEIAWKIINRQPKTSEFIFPYNSRTIGANFSRACKILSINDLHFHDLRHHGISLLFEAGLTIPQAQLITLHESWETMRIYANLSTEL